MGTQTFALVCLLQLPHIGRSAEVLYNGIELPSEWPPKLDEADIKARKPLPEPPYLQHPPPVISIDVGRQLFVDDFLVQEKSLKTTYHLAEYYPENPVFKEGMPYSGGVFWDPKEQIIKMWYHGDGGTALTVSHDGIHWDKGRLVLPGASDSQCVWLDLEETDPAKRYKMTRSVVGNNRCRGWIYTSSDGVSWKQAGFTGDWGDRSTFFWNPFRKVWVMSARHGWGQPRARRYFELKDFVDGPSWQKTDEPPIWVGADVLDPPRSDYKIAPQLYNLDAAGYESLIIGAFSIWRGQPPPRQKPNEVCLGFSRDGFYWTRPDRRPFCPVSETPGTWNYANVQSAAGGCLIMGDRLYFYVSARGTGQVAGLATLRRDGFASVDADERGGTLTTRVLTFNGAYPFVNANAPKGELRAEILDEDGHPIAPFTLANCRPVQTDSTIAPLHWKGAQDCAVVADKKVRFRFHLKNGSLYAFWVSSARTGASQGYVAGGGPGFTSNKDMLGRPDAYAE
jgi:hypothetical protein